MTPKQERILSTCLDRIVSGEWTVGDCLRQYPEEAEELHEFLTLASALQQTHGRIRPRRTFRLGGSARLLERLENSARPPAPAKVSLWDKVEEGLAGFLAGRRFAIAGAAMALLLAVFALGGLVSAADAAAPGDPLYRLDLAAEAARVRLTSDPAQIASLRMGFAAERLDEANRLASQGDPERFERAIFGYGTEVAAVTAAIQEGSVSDSSTLETVNRTMTEQEGRLNDIFARATGADDGEAASSIVCAEEAAGFMHPVAVSLAAQYGRDYEEVTSWFCAGYGFGEIMLALTTAAETEFSPEQLLAWKSDVGGWGQVWQAVDDGFPGPPEEVGPPDDAGPPDEAGPPEEVGPPDDAGRPDEVGPPDEPPGRGPPDEPPGGGPRDEVGPPDEPPGRGPPDEPPGGGPPDDVGPPDEPPGGGPPDEPPGGGPPDEPPGGGPPDEPPGGGPPDEPPGGGRPEEPPGGGRPEEPGRP